MVEITMHEDCGGGPRSGPMSQGRCLHGAEMPGAVRHATLLLLGVPR